MGCERLKLDIFDCELNAVRLPVYAIKCGCLNDKTTGSNSLREESGRSAISYAAHTPVTDVMTE